MGALPWPGRGKRGHIRRYQLIRSPASPRPQGLPGLAVAALCGQLNIVSFRLRGKEMSERKHGRARLWTVIAACVAVTVAGGVAVPTAATASPAVLAQAADTTIDEKYQAAAVLGWVP